ncbi:MAG: hypothetical protein RL616_103 [Verrucomicrobiota bacterium]
MKKILALTLFALLAVLSARADVIFKEQFKYTNGPAVGTATNIIGGVLVTNWIKFSGTATNAGIAGDGFIQSNRLEVGTSTAYLGVTTTRQDDIARQFSLTNNSIYTNVQLVIYTSFIINFTNLPTANGSYFAHFHSGVPTSSSFEGKLWALAGNPAQTTNNFTALPNTYRLGVTAANSGGPAGKIIGQDLALNTDYQVVLGWDPVTLSAVTLWINPISSSDPSITSGDPFTPSATLLANSFAFRQASGFGGFLTVSNLTVATTFVEAVTNTLSTNAVAPKIVFQPLGATNFVGGTFILTSLAAGQGQSALTYQWYLSNSISGFVPYSNPAGNTNVLTVTSAQTTDSGFYQLAVTTPYGLSVTTAPVKVLISATPVPPTFVTQPGSQSLYTGQNLILTTTVSSPGTPTFTWFSNNVVVQTDNGNGLGTSTFEIDNVVPANSATYKVAVTNDVVLQGIVSTNAVVTITDAALVTVSFLRSLVDPNNNYAPTNTTTPFKVTGILTTYTNLTSGNTTSYYLQDATAGINIFATFGSTFRPMMGDSVTFVGVLSSFSSGLELTADTTTKPYTSYIVNSSGNTLPTPLAIPFTYTNNNFSNVNYTIAGRYVQLTNVFFGTNAGSIITNGFVTVTNALGQKANLWFSALDPDVMGQTYPVYAKTVTGVVFGSMNAGNPNFAIAPTRFIDIDTNIAPVARPDSYSMAKNSPVTTLVPSPLANDLVYPPAFPATITAVTPANGTAVIINSGADIQFQPAANFTGAATINYDLTDALGGVSSSVITITVTNVAVVTPIALTNVVSGNNLTFTWSDNSFNLQTSTNLLGAWTTVSGAVSGFVTNITAEPTRFYRLLHP